MRGVALPRPGSVRPHWRYVARQWLWAGVDVLFPPQCAGCRRTGERFCSRCQAAVPHLPPPVCERCGYPLDPASPHRCHLPTQSALAGVRSVAYFEGPLREALHRLKYQRDVILADDLAHLLRDAWLALRLPGDTVTPIPLSAQRLRERGYNQAGLLARALAELTGLRYAPEALLKVRHTQSQVELSAAQRQANVAGAFRAAAGHAAGRAFILVDDVCTTGATLLSAAEALRAAGAAQVWGLTLGRAR